MKENIASRMWVITRRSSQHNVTSIGKRAKMLLVQDIVCIITNMLMVLVKVDSTNGFIKVGRSVLVVVW
jgi:hypothetical protein